MRTLTAVLALLLLAPLAVRAQQDSLNGWKFNRIIGSYPASASMRQVVDTATEGIYSQEFSVSVSNSGMVEFVKDFGRDVATPYYFTIDNYVKAQIPEDFLRKVSILPFLESGDTLYPTHGFDMGFPLLRMWFSEELGVNLISVMTGYPPPKHFRKIYLRFGLIDTTFDKTSVDVILDNFRAIYGHRDSFDTWREDSTVILDRFGDQNPSPGFQASAKELDFDSVAVGMTRTLPLTIKNTGNDTLRTTSLDWLPSVDFTFRLPFEILKIPPGDSVTGTITFTPSSPGPIKGGLIFKSNAGCDTIFFSGVGYNLPIQPALSLLERAIDFGNVSTISSKDTALTLRNTGNDTLQGTISVFGNGFSVKDSTLLIPPMDSVVKTVKFSPTIVGKLTGLLIIWSNDPTSPDTVLLSGFGDKSDGVDNNPLRPNVFSLSQNHPNPFNPSTVIEFSLAKRSYVNLAIYNMIGQKVVELADGEKAPGSYTVTFDGSKLPSGIYLYRLQAGPPTGGFTQTRRMVLVK
jgi:hypothetical protein